MRRPQSCEFAMAGQPIQLEDGWNQLKTGGVQKIEQILEDMQDGVYQTKISTDEYSKLHTCAPRPPCVGRPLPPGDRATGASCSTMEASPRDALA